MGRETAVQVGKEKLKDLLDGVHQGTIQLPDFQRPWTWDDERIVALLASVTLGYPMGVIMSLATGENARTRFMPRPLEDVPGDVEGKAQQLILDGQQRITSLYRALRSGRPVSTKDRDAKPRWYYIDIAKALDPDVDRDTAIVSVPEDRKVVRNGRVVQDLSTIELELEHGMFPLMAALDDGARTDWQFKYIARDPARYMPIWTQFTSEALNPIMNYEVPTIVLGPETAKEAVCRVFEKVNTGGVELKTFELVTATYAADDFPLPDHWANIHKELRDASPMFHALEGTDFLQAVCLVATYHHKRAPTCKRKDLLDLQLDWYREWERPVVNALLWVGKFLADQGVVSKDFLPYRTQIPPLAAIRALLGDEADASEAQEKLLRWYWCGVFGEQYGGSLDSRFVADLQDVTAWVRGGDEPGSVRDASFNMYRLETMNTRNSAAYTGVFARLIGQGCHDWYFMERPLSAESLIDHSVQIGRVFPAAWCKKHNAKLPYDSVINKALFSQRVMQTIGNRAPSLYAQELERDAGVRRATFDDALASQLVSPRHLRADRFGKFCEDRADRLLKLIGDSGVPVIRDGTWGY